MLNYYVLTTLLTLFSLIILIFIYENRKSTFYFMIILILLALANGGYLALALSTTVEEAILANKITYLGGCFAPTVTLFFVCQICNYNVPSWITRSLYAFSFLVYSMVLTTGFKNWYYEECYLESYNNVTVLAHTYGKFHVLFYIMLCSYFVMAAVLLWYSLVRKHTVSRRNLYALLIMGMTSIILFIAGRMINPYIEIMPLVYVIESWIFLYMYRRGLMYSLEDNIAGSVGNQDSNGYIMFDKQLNYLGCNAVALKIFPALADCIVDKPIKNNSKIKDILNWLESYSTGKEESFSLEKEDRHFECTITKMWYRKKLSGYILEVREDTEKWKYVRLISEHNLELESFQAELERKVNEQTLELRAQQKRLKELFVRTVTALSEAVDAKDRYTSGHSKRVAEYARMIAIKMGKSKEEQEAIYRAGLLHDVGKIRIPAEIINKPGKLTEEEYNIIKIHPVTGYHILRGISDDNFIAVAAKYHHERYDGKGYPNGLMGAKIPEVARILAVADSYDAMASNRSYRNALPQEVVRAEIEKGKGTQFDPSIAEIMLQMIDEDKGYHLKQTDSMQRKILSVDDEAMNNKIIAHIMSDEPMYEVVSVNGGKQALEILEHQSFDLILLDVKMPEMDGMETLKCIREKYNTPVVLMTSDKTLDLSAEFSQYNCDDYITKPFLPLLVKEVVHNMTERTNIENS